MIPSNFNIRRIHVRSRPTKQDTFSRGFQEVVVDLECAIDVPFNSVSSANSRCIGARPYRSNAVETTEIGIDHADGTSTTNHHDSFCHLSAFCRVEPVTVEDDVVCALGRDQPSNVRCGLRGPLNTEKAVMVADSRASWLPDDKGCHQLCRSAG